MFTLHVYIIEVYNFVLHVRLPACCVFILSISGPYTVLLCLGCNEFCVLARMHPHVHVHTCTCTHMHAKDVNDHSRKLFTEAEEEQTKMGSASGLHIIIFDEIDAICKERGTVVRKYIVQVSKVQFESFSATIH